jgi:hypothetical protein
MSSSNGALKFAVLKSCRNCQTEVIKSLKINPEQICKPCLRGLARKYCIHCKKDYHQLEVDVNSGKPNRCKNCQQSFKEHGAPSACEVCSLNSAFGTSRCRHCKKNSERYGKPIVCYKCGKCCAFNKPQSKKVGGKDLCFTCGREHKLQEHRESKKNKRENKQRKTTDSTPKKRKRSNESQKKRKSKPSRDKKHQAPTELTSNDTDFFGSSAEPVVKKRKYTGSPNTSTVSSAQVEAYTKEIDELRKQVDEHKRRAAQLSVTVEAQKIQLAKMKRDVQEKDATLGEFKARNHDLKDGLQIELKKVRRECAKEIREHKVMYKNLMNKYETIRRKHPGDDVDDF